MLHVPARFAPILVAFAPVFVQARTWRNAQMLLLGALLVPGQRTVCSILRIIGLRQGDWREIGGARPKGDIFRSAFPLG
jgi:hypothetical protein